MTQGKPKTAPAVQEQSTEEVRIVTVQLRLERIAPDGFFHCSVNPFHEEARWMSMAGGEVHIMLCEECKKHLEAASVSSAAESSTDALVAETDGYGQAEYECEPDNGYRFPKWT